MPHFSNTDLFSISPPLFCFWTELNIAVDQAEKKFLKCCTWRSFGDDLKEKNKVYKSHPLVQLPFLLRVVGPDEFFSEWCCDDVWTMWWIWVFRCFSHTLDSLWPVNESGAARTSWWNPTSSGSGFCVVKLPLWRVSPLSIWMRWKKNQC